jgi:hypothetical protein
VQKSANRCHEATSRFRALVKGRKALGAVRTRSPIKVTPEMRSQEFRSTGIQANRHGLGPQFTASSPELGTNERKTNMSLLVIFYWILLLLWVIGAFSAGSWPQWSYANAILLLILFIIIGIKILKPTW